MTTFKFDPQKPFDCFIVQSESMRSAVENAKRFAMFDAPLLIQGETGTGKDFLPLDVVSTGEYLLVAFLLMDIINQITDARYLVIDNLDALDEEHTKVFLDMLDKDSSYEHIFIGAVNHDDTKRAVSKYRVYEL